MLVSKPYLAGNKKSKLAVCSSAVIGVGKACDHSGLQVRHGDRWEDGCNSCQCMDENIRCTKVSFSNRLKTVLLGQMHYMTNSVWTRPLFQVRCGRQPCLLHSGFGQPQLPMCPEGQRCVEHRFLSCLHPPCHQLGICSSPERLQPISTQCLPNNTYLDENCARVTLVFDYDSVPQVRVNHSFHLKKLFGS